MNGASDVEAVQLMGAYLFGGKIQQARLDDDVLRDLEPRDEAISVLFTLIPRCLEPPRSPIDEETQESDGDSNKRCRNLDITLVAKDCILSF